MHLLFSAIFGIKATLISVVFAVDTSIIGMICYTLEQSARLRRRREVLEMRGRSKRTRMRALRHARQAALARDRCRAGVRAFMAGLVDEEISLAGVDGDPVVMSGNRIWMQGAVSVLRAGDGRSLSVWRGEDQGISSGGKG